LLLSKQQRTLAGNLLGPWIPSLEEIARQMEAIILSVRAKIRRRRAQPALVRWGRRPALPSVEPCGLAQMIAGAAVASLLLVPRVVRDTIVDNDHQGAATGFLFSEPFRRH
jgi:hypothetical protein